MKRFLPSLVLLVLLGLLLPTQSFAVDFCPAGSQFGNLCGLNIDNNATILSKIIQIILVIAAIASLFFLLFGGIKWIMSGGDKTKVGEARGMLTAAIVGFIITFSSFFILNIVSGFFGLRVGTIFVIPRLTNEVPIPPTDVTNVAPPCPNGGQC